MTAPIELTGEALVLRTTHPEDAAELRRIRLEPGRQRRGFASEALRLVAAHLTSERGHHRLVIDPAADNEAAIACYSKLGFRAVGRMRRSERDGDGGG